MNDVQTLNVVQEVATGRRERNRLERHRAFVRTAKAIVAGEGLQALTMQRLARELDCAVGTAYTYFPSKSALVAELQRDAFDVLTEAYLGFHLKVLEASTRTDTTGAAAALAQILGVCRFWVAAERSHPDEFRLMQLLLVETGTDVIDDADVARVLPAGIRILDYAEAAMAGAAAIGALTEGDARERVLVLGFSLNGVLAVGRMARIDPDRFDGPRLALVAATDLLTAWGADPAQLAAAARCLDSLSKGRKT
jgi:AcrR family transcriptional regulator